MCTIPFLIVKNTILYVYGALWTLLVNHDGNWIFFQFYQLGIFLLFFQFILFW